MVGWVQVGEWFGMSSVGWWRGRRQKCGHLVGLLLLMLLLSHGVNGPIAMGPFRRTCRKAIVTAVIERFLVEIVVCVEIDALV